MFIYLDLIILLSGFWSNEIFREAKISGYTFSQLLIKLAKITFSKQLQYPMVANGLDNL